VIAAAIAILLTRQNLPMAAPRRSNRPIATGAFHVHTDRSPDGASTGDAAVAAAARAGLQFVVATEHGDGTRAPLPPAYRAGVLWIDGVEISTADGHYATFGMKQTPYPLAGDARDVVEDVARFGGTGVAAHGDSQRSEARWRDWSAAIDGLEWLNLDSVWREAGALRLAGAAFTYWLRPSKTLASLGSRPVATLDHLDQLAQRRRVITLAATDAHGRTVPSYDACFGAFSTRVELDRPLTGEATADAASLLIALRAGHHYTSIDALARPAGFEFTASSGGAVANEGDALPGGQPVAFDIRVDGPPGATAILRRNGVVVGESRAPAWRHETDGRQAEYRVEVLLPDSPGTPPLPWIVSNPIFVGISEAAPSPPPPDGVALPTPPFAWHVEKDAASTAVLASTASDLTLRYTLGGGVARDQFAAAVAPLDVNVAAASGLGFTVQADHPLRFSVELRAGVDRRWQRSIYADQTPRRVVVAFDDMRAVQPDETATARASGATGLLVIAGVGSTAPGSSGDVELTNIAVLKF
jgi:hypothetical protein